MDPSGSDPTDTPTPQAQQEPEWQKRRRLAEIFGDPLPDATSDDRDPGGRQTGGGAGESASDRWLREQVPPHHGG